MDRMDWWMWSARHETCRWTAVYSGYVNRRTAWNVHCGIQLYVRCYESYTTPHKYHNKLSWVCELRWAARNCSKKLRSIVEYANAQRGKKISTVLCSNFLWIQFVQLSVDIVCYPYVRPYREMDELPVSCYRFLFIFFCHLDDDLYFLSNPFSSNLHSYYIKMLPLDTITPSFSFLAFITKTDNIEKLENPEINGKFA